MNEKGANTFPFHNLPPELKKISQRSFLFFSPFPYWIKEKLVATLAIYNNCDQTQNNQVSSPIVLQSATEIRNFLGLAGYYRRFIKSEILPCETLPHLFNFGSEVQLQHSL